MEASSRGTRARRCIPARVTYSIVPCTSDGQDMSVHGVTLRSISAQAECAVTNRAWAGQPSVKGDKLRTGNWELQAGGWVGVLVAGGRSWVLGEGAGGSLRLAAAAGSSEHQHAAGGERLPAASSSQLSIAKHFA